MRKTSSDSLARRSLLEEIVSAVGAAERAGGGDAVSADRAVEPVPAVAALHFRKPLLFFALGTAFVHFALLHVVCKQQSAARAFLRTRFFDGKAAVGRRTDKNGFAVAAPVFSFCLLTTDRAFLHSAPL